MDDQLTVAGDPALSPDYKLDTWQAHDLSYRWENHPCHIFWLLSPAYQHYFSVIRFEHQSISSPLYAHCPQILCHVFSGAVWIVYDRVVSLKWFETH